MVGAGLLWYRATLHNWPWQGDPARLSACGRDYADGGGLVGSPGRLYPLFRAPPFIGPEVYSALSPSRRAELSKSGGTCDGLVLYIETPPVDTKPMGCRVAPRPASAPQHPLATTLASITLSRAVSGDRCTT